MLSHPQIAISLRTHGIKENQLLANEELKFSGLKRSQGIVNTYSNFTLTFMIRLGRFNIPLAKAPR